MHAPDKLLHCVYHSPTPWPCDEGPSSSPQQLDEPRATGPLFERWGCELGEFNGEPDHVQLLVRMHASVKPSVLERPQESSRPALLHRNHGKELRRHFRRPALWSRSCCLPPAAARCWRHSANQAGAGWGPLAPLHRPPSSRSGRAHCAAIGVEHDREPRAVKASRCRHRPAPIPRMASCTSVCPPRPNRRARALRTGELGQDRPEPRCRASAQDGERLTAARSRQGSFANRRVRRATRNLFLPPKRARPTQRGLRHRAYRHPRRASHSPSTMPPGTRGRERWEIGALPEGAALSRACSATLHLRIAPPDA